MGDSIFEFADRLGYESPFEDWLPKIEPIMSLAEIVSIRIEKPPTPLSSFLLKTFEDTNTDFIVQIFVKVQIKGATSKVVISIDGQSGLANKFGSSTDIFARQFNVRVPKSFVRIDMSNSKEFEIKVTCTDLSTKTISDTQAIKTVISSDGSFSNAGGEVGKDKFNCSYTVKDGFVVGDNVTTSRTDSKVKAGGTLQKPVKAIVLHRTVGSSIAGAISHSKGTHFYVEGGKKGKDGEVFQAMSLVKSSNHIFDTTDRLSHLDVKTGNSIGIEVIGLAYFKKDGKLYKNYGDMSVVANPPKLSKAYLDNNKRENYWDALTEAQIKSVVCLVKLLMKEFSIPSNMILTHEEIQSKTAGEGQTVKDAIFSYIIND